MHDTRPDAAGPDRPAPGDAGPGDAGPGDAGPGDAGLMAAGAARSAAVEVGPVEDVAGLWLVAGLFSRIWDAPDVPPMPHDLMRSIVHAGGRVHAAFRDGQVAGATVAVFGPPVRASCYSLIAGVAPGAQGGGVGLALKLAQRAWALRAGATHMVWTYDPLLRRNARFNLVRLGATVTEYLVDFYGEIADGVNDPVTDRVAVSWDLRAAMPAPRPGAAGPGSRAPGPGEPGSREAGPGEPGTGKAGAAPAVLSAGPGGEPVPRAAAGQRGSLPPAVRCAIPEDILAVRRRDPGLARRWRFALRTALTGALDEGYRITGLAGPGWYLLEREGAGR